MQKGFADYFAALHADFFCLQETKLQPEQIAVAFPGYLQFWNSAEKKGYSGTAVFTKHPRCPSPTASALTSWTMRVG